MIIDGKELDPNDIGRLIVYTHRHGATDVGKLVKYEDGKVYVQFDNKKGELCEPSLLEWLPSETYLFT